MERRSGARARTALGAIASAAVIAVLGLPAVAAAPLTSTGAVASPAASPASGDEPIGLRCEVSWHAFVSPFYPAAFIDGVTFTFTNVGDRPVSGVGVRLDYLGRTLHFTDEVTLAKRARDSRSHRIAKNLPYVGREADCSVESVTFADGSVRGTAPTAAPAK